jgi:hypothetical protein
MVNGGLIFMVNSGLRFVVNGTSTGRRLSD